MYYLQNPIMRRFLREHKLDFGENRADYIKSIEEYASQNDETERETIEVVIKKLAKEGSKEICYRKIRGIETRLSIGILFWLKPK